MSFFTQRWFNRSANRLTSASQSVRHRQVRRRRGGPGLRCEALEARRLLTSYLVDTVADTIAEDGFVSLREAIQAANTNSAVNEAPAGIDGSVGIDTIRFAPELGDVTILLGGTELVISDSLTISSGDASSVVIDAGDASRVLNVTSGADIVTLRDISLTGGVQDNGGGLMISSGGRVTLDNVTVEGNEAIGPGATQGGGGIYNENATLSILGGSIANNVASGASGSGGGLFSLAGQVTVSETSIQSNVANRAGGGIELVTGSLVLNDVTLGGQSSALGNIAGPDGSAAPGNGGGLHVSGDGGSTLTLVTVTGGMVANNLAASEGGGLWNQAGATMSVTGGTSIINNFANGATNTEGGGGIFNNGGLLILSDISLRNNATLGDSGGGGGLASDGGTVTIDNSLFAGNVAAGSNGSGGGILGLGSATIAVVETEISGNIASRAGGGIEIATDASAANALSLIGVELSENNAGVIDGDATASSPGNGGGLHVTGSGNVLVIDTRVQGNIAAKEGGGLWNGSGIMTIDNSQIINNVASGDEPDDGGGGIFNNGGAVTLNATTVDGNRADGTSGSGGGILNLGGSLTVDASSISNNTANRAGGGIETTDGSGVSLNDVNLDRNYAGVGTFTNANPGSGGGLHVTGNAAVTLVGGTVIGNVAAAEGGGLWNGSGTMTVDGTTIVRNVASGDDSDQGGGGIYNEGGEVLLTSVDIASNVADGTSGSGGGILNASGGSITVADSSIQGNVANRAGGGIETTAGSDVTLNRVELNANNAGVSASLGPVTNPLLVYDFNETGLSALAGGSAADASGNPLLNFFGNDGNPSDLHGPAGSGVSGDPDDRAFDNTSSSGILTASHGRHAEDFEPIDALAAFTLSGWFMVPATASESIGRQSALIENGTVSVTDAPGGYRLRGGPSADSGTLELRVNRDESVESSPVYTEIGQYVYFAVSYDGTSSSDNVRFYKGTVGGAVTLVDTLTLDAGSVLDEDIPLSIGVTRTSGLTLNPFNGLLDDIRIDDSIVSLGELESRRFAATGLSDSIAGNPGSGGGLHITGDAVVRINDGTVNGNLASRDGGGLWNSATGNLIVDGTVIENNSATDGGGVYSDGGNTSLTNVVVSDNVASQNGGGIYSEAGGGAFSNLTITDSAIDGNVAGATQSGTGGGGIFAAGRSELVNTDITNNTAVQGTADGGGVLAALGSDFSIDGGVIQGNDAARAGGGVENLGFFTSFDTTFDGNFAGVNGGALHQSGTAFSVIANAEVIGNSAANEGGGFWTSNGGFLSVLDSNFDNNQAMFGGALFGDGEGADLSVDRSTFTNNAADVNGGALAIEGGSLFLADNSFSGNSAGGNAPGLGGGAIFTAASNEMLNNDLLNNTAAMPMGNGGGILIAAGGSGTYFGGVIQGNRAGRAGGGLEVVGQITLDREVLSDNELTIDDNSAGINGGGLHISGTGEVLIRRSTVTNNVADGEGGGLWNSSSGTLTVNTTTVSGNVASGDDPDQGGGGIFNDGGTLELNETTVTNNLADGTSGSGGGLLIKGGTLTATNASISGNIAVRAGGGIESTAGASISLTDVTLDNNSAGLDRSLAGSTIPVPLLEYRFNEMGTSALATGSAADASGNPMLNFFNNSGNPADLHSGPSSGVSGEPDDFAFDNTASSGLFGASRGQHSTDFDPIDALDAFTLSGWFMLPASAPGPIGLQDALIENGTLSGTGAGFRLRGGPRTGAGTLELRVNGGLGVESSPAYTEIGEYVYFAVSYDGTQATDNVKFYKGTVDDGVTLVDTLSLPSGTVLDENVPLVVGLTRGALTTGNFNGLLDNIRIDSSVLPLDSLEFLRADDAGQTAGIEANPGNGGGLHVTGMGEVNIVRGSVTNNFAASEGGGLWNDTGSMTVEATTVSGNIAAGDAADNGGGGIFNNGGTLDVVGAAVTNNLATGASGSGGGIFSTAGDVTITTTTIDSNGANRAGGGIEIIDGMLTLTDVELVNNDVSGALTNGMAAPGNGGGLHGSGIAEILIDGGNVTGNTAGREGGGLWNQAGSTMTIRNVDIQFNTALGDAADDGGGGVFNNGGVIDISDTSIISNFADGMNGSGGGIFNFNAGVITIRDSSIVSNVASRAGGGIEDASFVGGATATGTSIAMTGVMLDQNNAGVIDPRRGGALFSSPGNGGGLHITGAGNVSISDSSVSDNVAGNEGGGLWNATGTLTIDSVTVAGNESIDGAGVFNDSAVGDVIIVNSTLSGNEASGGGGGLRSEGGNVTLTSVTIADNSADGGGGIDVLDGTVTVGSSIVGTNSAAIGPDIRGAVTSDDYNVIGNTSGATITGDGDNDQLDVDPGLAPLSNNGGPTRTHSLLPSSTALNNGRPGGVSVDQRGVARPQGGGPDSGAFESALTGIAAAVANSLRSDVDGNGVVTAADALMVINFLNLDSPTGEAELSESETIESQSTPTASESTVDLDVSGDGKVTALDALMIINSLNTEQLLGDEVQAVASNADLAFGNSALPANTSVFESRRQEIDELLLEQLAIDALAKRQAV